LTRRKDTTGLNRLKLNSQSLGHKVKRKIGGWNSFEEIILGKEQDFNKVYLITENKISKKTMISLDKLGASISISSNIAEVWEKYWQRVYLLFICCKASAGEVRSQLYPFDLNYLLRKFERSQLQKYQNC
jgi:four helix bundle protein